MDISTLKNEKEYLAGKVHDAWWDEKAKQGFHSPSDCFKSHDRFGKFDKRCPNCHADMYPYEELPENIKDYDRITVQTVLDAIKSL